MCKDFGKKTYLIGLAQAAGVAMYCLFVSWIFSFLRNFPDAQLPPLFAPAFMLMFLVFSAALTGSLVFGYPVYLLINKEIKRAISILLFTLLFCFILGGVILSLAVLFM